MIPVIRYAKTPEGVHIAYQVVGDGPTDLVWPGPGYSNIEYLWRLQPRHSNGSSAKHGQQARVEESPEARRGRRAQLVDHGLASQSFISRGTISVIHGTNATSNRPRSRAIT